LGQQFPEGANRHVAAVNQELVTGVALSGLPRGVRIIFTVIVNGEETAWAGMTLFQYNKLMRAGTQSLRLWPGPCPTSMATTLENRNHSGFAADIKKVRHKMQKKVKAGHDIDRADFERKLHPEAPVLELRLPQPSKPIIFTDHGQEDATLPPRPDPSDPVGPELLQVMRRDPLHNLTLSERSMVWEARMLLSHHRTALAKVLKSVDWTQRDQVQQVYRLLHLWAVPGALEALQLLDS